MLFFNISLPRKLGYLLVRISLLLAVRIIVMMQGIRHNETIG